MNDLSRQLVEAVKAKPKKKKISAIRSKVTAKFKQAGLDGNGRFRKAQDGYAKALDVLGDFGVELDDVVSSHLFNVDAGRVSVSLAWSTDDPFSPVSIGREMLIVSWTKMDNGRFEVLAYLS